MSNKNGCFAIGTPIMKFINNEYKIVSVEDICIGDCLIGSDGKFTNIKKIFNGYGKLYKIDQENGLSYIVTDFYKIPFCFSNNKKIELTIDEYQKLDKLEKNKLYVYKTNIDFDKKELIYGDPYDYGMRIDETNQLSIHNSYKYNTKNIRLELLAGLIDSFGLLENPDIYQFNITNKELLDDIVFISRSLGLKTYIKSIVYSDTKKNVTHDIFIISIVDEGHIDIPIRNILMKHVSELGKYKPYLTNISLVNCLEGEFIGFELDNDGKFIAADFTIMNDSRTS